MNKHSPVTPIRKIIGAGLLAASLAVLTGCATDSTEAAPAPSSTAPAPEASPEPAEPMKGRFVKIIDGDTIEIEPVSAKDGQPTGEPNLTVSMLGVEAPAEAACGSEEAVIKLGTMFRENEPVTVTHEPTLQEDTDEDGSLLAYITTGAGVTMDIGLAMVEGGYATASYPEGEQAPARFDRYETLNQAAVERDLGIWAACEV